MGHQIREHMSEVDGEEPLSGHVEVDETYVGGKAKGIRGRGAKNKTIVFGMMERNGDVMTKVVPNVKERTLVPEIVENVEPETTISSDELRSYGKLKFYGFKHHTVQHGRGEYVRGEVHVNGLEGYWSYLKRSIRSTHIAVDSQYLENYSKEFEYRWNSRKNPERMFPELISTFRK